MNQADPITSPRILMVEDDADHQHLLEQALNETGVSMNIRMVSTGTQLLECLRNDSYDCVVADFHLPDFRASELVEQAAEYLTATPVVIVSTCRDQAPVIDSFRSGVVDFVPKDKALEGDTLWRSIEHAICESQRRKAERREQDRRERHLAQLAESDQLTGLFNRRYFQRCIEEGVWANDRRKTASIIMLDIDHFKRVNDTYGHHAGDDVLCQTADFILTQVEGSDTVIRWGGEEFLIVRMSSPLVESIVWAERLRRLIEHRGVRSKGELINVTVSAGIYECHADGLGIEAVDVADSALYLAKDRGRNQVCSSLMVQMRDFVQQVSTDSSLAPSGRLERLIQRITPSLGTTQLEHLTDHAEQVATMACEIARVLHLPVEVQEQIHVAGLLHDIGKCMIPESVLAKPSRLTLVERAVVSRHAEFGAEIATMLGFDPLVVRMVREHHMRHDATVPQADGENGHAHIGSRVLCASDALVTMMTCRTYQTPKPLVNALRELRTERGRQFDPEVVDAAHFIESLFSLAA